MQVTTIYQAWFSCRHKILAIEKNDIPWTCFQFVNQAILDGVQKIYS